jgi:DNA repair protein RadA/Sms
MAKLKTIFACQNCGAQSPKWLGRCPDCGQWNTYVEETIEPQSSRSPLFDEYQTKLQALTDIQSDEGAHASIGIAELDRVLGGGYIPGSVTLIGGDPGIGKSTIILQALSSICRHGQTSLYISGEESASQIKLRANRMGIKESNLLVVTENCVEKLIDHIKKAKPKVVAVDSIQTIYTNEIHSAPGTVSQIRDSAARLLYLAKGSGIAMFLVGHVTKEGSIAGPKVLEHMVDTVLYFEGERGHPFRILRTVKNRFGSTNEIGVFEMTGKGLLEVSNPSSIFLAERPPGVAGSVVVSSLEGSRPVLLELQALISGSGLTNPRRTAIGLDTGRVALLVAVLEKLVGLQLYDQDIFLNVAGGIKISEPAPDLGVVSAISSSFKNKPVDHETIVIGEVGLTGEVRTVLGCDIRLKEGEKLGFKRAIIPKSNLKSKITTRMDIVGVTSVEQCLETLF